MRIWWSFYSVVTFEAEKNQSTSNIGVEFDVKKLNQLKHVMAGIWTWVPHKTLDPVSEISPICGHISRWLIPCSDLSMHLICQRRKAKASIMQRRSRILWVCRSSPTDAALPSSAWFANFVQRVVWNRLLFYFFLPTGLVSGKSEIRQIEVRQIEGWVY